VKRDDTTLGVKKNYREGDNTTPRVTDATEEREQQATLPVEQDGVVETGS
jgi:hypothetical protein